MRGKGEGSVYQQSDGLWAASIELPTRDGSRRRKVVRAKSKAELIKVKLPAVRRQLETTGDVPTASQTVESWMSYWLREVAEKENRPTTVANYRWATNVHIIPVIGKTRLDKVTPSTIRRVNDAVLSKLSPTTAATVHRVMSSAFGVAEREGRMQRNPAALVAAPRIPATNLEVLTVEEFVRLISLFGDNSARYLWATYMLTGTRRGEILGLEWDRVTSVLDLSWQLQRHKVDIVAPADYEYRRLRGGIFLTRPKSKAGWRVVPLVQPLAGILEAWRTAAPENAYGLVFAREDGHPFDPGHISKEWPRILKAAGIDKKVRLHDLRHTAIDMMYEAGVHETTITEIVGHSTRSMTRGYKSRGNRKQLVDGMNQFSALLGLPSVASLELGSVDDFDERESEFVADEVKQVDGEGDLTA